MFIWHSLEGIIDDDDDEEDEGKNSAYYSPKKPKEVVCYVTGVCDGKKAII